MKNLLVALAILGVLATANWAYRQNYAARAVQEENRRLRSEIADARKRLEMLRAEWAYLNRPDRLRGLVSANFDRLPLFPLLPEQLVRFEDLGTLPTPKHMTSPVVEVMATVADSDASSREGDRP